MTLQNTPRFNRLLNRLIVATEERGQKVKLARFLNSPLSRVSEWLNGARIPGAEVTLSLLEWVQVEEAQQNKNRSSAQTPLRRKTRSTQSSYEKRKPSPRKK